MVLLGGICLSLIAIAYLDFKFRAVYIWLFALVGLLLLLLKYLQNHTAVFTAETGLNVLFLVFQFLFLKVYFRLRTGKWKILMDQQMGWGDVVFMFCVALYLPFLSFFIFHILSLSIVLFFTVFIPKWRDPYFGIPLAGCQSLLFGIWLMIRQFDILDIESYFSKSSLLLSII